MRLLLDTHALIWWLFDSQELSDDARRSIADPDAEANVSAASGWEIATKHRLGKLPEVGDLPARLPAYLRRGRLDVLQISVEHALAAGALPGPHRDPYDRMMIAQARIEVLTVVTGDPVFADYGVPVCW